jgi:DNA sulfur modification protein DndC
VNASVETINNLIAEHGHNLAIVCCVSGGKDSSRMLGCIRQHFPAVKTYVVMADTGFEHVQPVTAEAWARRITASFGLELHMVKNPNKTYLEMVERRGMFPGAATRQCTSDLKRGPIQKFIRHLDEKFIINCTGIRAAESPARAKQTPWKFDEGMSKAGRTVWNWMPIFTDTLQDVLQWHWFNNVPLHPVYAHSYHKDGTTGGYLRRFSCRVCIFSTDNDIRAIYQHDRQAFDLVAGLEERMGFTMKNGKSLFQIIGQTATDNRQYGSEEQYPCAA